MKVNHIRALGKFKCVCVCVCVYARVWQTMLTLLLFWIPNRVSLLL